MKYNLRDSMARRAFWKWGFYFILWTQILS